MTSWLLARWALVGPRTRAALGGYFLPVLVLGVALAPLWAVLTLCGLWLLVVTLGLASALLEVARERSST